MRKINYIMTKYIKSFIKEKINIITLKNIINTIINNTIKIYKTYLYILRTLVLSIKLITTVMMTVDKESKGSFESGE